MPLRYVTECSYKDWMAVISKTQGNCTGKQAKCL
jgi:hypothetical protein